MTNKIYNAEFLCTYKMMDDDEDKNDLYRIQFLQAFDLNNFNEDILNKKLMQLYDKVKECNQLKEIIEEYSKVNQNMCKIVIFAFLFSYDFFDLFHKCLIDFFNFNVILENTKNDLIQKIKTTFN